MAQQTRERSNTGVPAAAGGDHGAFLRWAGYSGVLASLAFLINGIVANVSGVEAPADAGDIVAYLQDVAQAAWSSYAYGFTGIALVVLYVPMAVGVNRLLGRTPAAWFGTAAVIGGLAVLFPAYVISIAEASGLAPAAAGVGGTGAEALYVTYSYAGAAADVFFAVGSVLSLGFGPLLWAIEWVRSRAARRWLGWAGLVVGVTGMVWLTLGVANPVLTLLVVVNVLVSLVFFTGASLVLVSEGRSMP